MTPWPELLLVSALSCLGQLCQKQATQPAVGTSRLRHYSLWLAAALLFLGSGILLWLQVLQHIPVGIAYPLLSLNYIWVALFSHFIWRETITLRHWIGIGLIISGTLVLGGSI